jgi:ribosomal protein L37AE/L43A
VARKTKAKNVLIRCPHCEKINTMLETASVCVTCSRCGKDLYTPGIEVVDKADSKLYDDLNRQRREDIQADKEKD